jgi:L-ascorbate metabolism protein UlaG (beta-lactamase superfamily)
VAVSTHYDGKRFRNPGETGRRRFSDFLRWIAGKRQAGSWTRNLDPQPAPPPSSLVASGNLRATFVNHSTVLIQMDGKNFLFDPIWSDRASPFSWIGPMRYRSPGIRFEDLPPIDTVLISHDHYDHFDVPTLRLIAERWKPKFAVPLGLRSRLLKHEIAEERDVFEMDWWQTMHLAENMTLTCVPARHFSGRGLRDRNNTLWCGWVIQGPSGTLYFAGDTGYGPHFREIQMRYPEIRLALLPIAAFRPEWFMAPVHMSPAEAVRAHQELNASSSMAIHYGTFRLADDGQNEAVDELRRIMKALPASRFWALDFGEGRDIPEITAGREAS